MDAGMMTPKTFSMIRGADESGVSGTGLVLNGVIWPNGKVSVCWCVEGMPSSITNYDCFEDFTRIHISAHPTNKTQVVYHNWNEVIV